jgi:hypothetical protein
MNYQQALQALLDASGKVETEINSVTPSPGQMDLLAFLQGPLKDQIAAAQNDSAAA